METEATCIDQAVRVENAKLAERVEVYHNILIDVYPAKIIEAEELKSEKDHLQKQLDAMQHDICHEDSAKKELEQKLQLAQNNYICIKEKLNSLVKQLVDETNELEIKSLEVSKLQLKNVDFETEVKASRKWEDDCYQMEIARRISQRKYLTEINVSEQVFSV